MGPRRADRRQAFGAGKLDIVTLFAANAIILLAMAGAFVAAWSRQRDEPCWPTWTAANVVLAVALLLFMFLPEGTSGTIALPHCLLVLGFGLRWRAANLLTDGVSGWWPVSATSCLAVLLFALPSIFSPGLVFAIVNIILAGLAYAAAHHFWVRREQSSISSYGLVFAYGIMAGSFALRVGQGLAYFDHFSSYLPHDEMLQLHLVIAIVHSSASGAFALSIAYERAALHLAGERDRVKADARKLAHLAERDALTGLLNRRAIEDRFPSLRGDGFDTLALLDLDHFKIINDTHGHGKGDEVLRAVGRALSPDRDCLAVRLGGEEFMLLLRGRGAQQRAEQRRRAITLRIAAEVPGLGHPVTASMGLVELPRRGMTVVALDELYSAADRLLYEAKEGGRNRTISEKWKIFTRSPRDAGNLFRVGRSKMNCQSNMASKSAAC